jgi:TonB family protein
VDVPHDSALAPRPEPHRWTVALSLLLHAGLLAAVVIGSVVDACGPRLPPPEKAIAARLVRLGTPRDPKMLPRKPVDPPAPPPTPREAPVAKPAPDPAPSPVAKVPTPSVAAAAPAAEKPDPTRKLDDIMKRFSTQNAAMAKAEKAIGQLDGDAEGDAEQAEEGERYLALVQKRIRDRYQLPSTISDTERIRLISVVTIHIDPAGKIFQSDLAQSSGNAMFDSAVQSAIQRAATVPPPPEHLRDMLRRGIDLKFRP